MSLAFTIDQDHQSLSSQSHLIRSLSLVSNPAILHGCRLIPCVVIKQFCQSDKRNLMMAGAFLSVNRRMCYELPFKVKSHVSFFGFVEKVWKSNSFLRNGSLLCLFFFDRTCLFIFALHSTECSKVHFYFLFKAWRTHKRLSCSRKESGQIKCHSTTLNAMLPVPFGLEGKRGADVRPIRIFTFPGEILGEILLSWKLSLSWAREFIIWLTRALWTTLFGGGRLFVLRCSTRDARDYGHHSVYLQRPIWANVFGTGCQWRRLIGVVGVGYIYTRFILFYYRSCTQPSQYPIESIVTGSVSLRGSCFVLSEWVI